MHNTPHTEASKLKMSRAHKGKPLPWRRRASREVNGITLWKCSSCRHFLPLEGFYKNKRTLLGITSECRKCHSATSIRTRDKENARKIRRESSAKIRRNNPEKARAMDAARSKLRPKTHKTIARLKLNMAVKRGDILRPKRCASCNEERKTQAHHSDYSKHLSVEWLCSLCHGKKHRKD